MEAWNYYSSYNELGWERQSSSMLNYAYDSPQISYRLDQDRLSYAAVCTDTSSSSISDGTSSFSAAGENPRLEAQVLIPESTMEEEVVEQDQVILTDKKARLMVGFRSTYWILD